MIFKIKKNLFEYLLYILCCIKIYSYNKKKDYKKLILFVNIFIIIKLSFKLKNTLSLFISFIISKCLIDNNKKVEKFGIIGDIFANAIKDIIQNPTASLNTAKDMIVNKIDVARSAFNAFPITQAIYKANNFVKKTVGINPQMFIPGMSQMALIKALYEVVKSDNPCDFCTNSMNAIFVKGLGKAKKKLNAGKYCKKAGSIATKAVDKIMKSKYIKKMKKRMAASSIEKKKPWIILAIPAIMKIYKKLLIIVLTKSCAQYATKGIVTVVSAVKSSSDTIENFDELSKVELIDISKIWLDMIRPVCEEFKIDGGEIFGTLGPMCSKSCDETCQQRYRNQKLENQKEYAARNTNNQKDFSEDIKPSNPNNDIAVYSLIKSKNLVYSITQNIIAAKNSTFANLTTTSQPSIGYGATLTIKTDRNGYCNSVEIIDTGIDYRIGDQLIVSKKNIEGSNKDLIFTLKDINLKNTTKVELGLTYTCNRSVGNIQYGKCLDSQSNIIDNIKKSDCKKPNTWLEAKMYNKTCKGWYKLACYNKNNEIVKNEDNCDTGDWNTGRCLVNIEKDKSKCNGYKEIWNDSTSKCQKERSNRENCEAKGYKFKHGDLTTGCYENVTRVLNKSEDGYCLCGTHNYNTNSIFELQGTDYVKPFTCSKKCKLAFQCERCSFEMAKYIADKLNKRIDIIDSPIKGLFKEGTKDPNVLFYSDPNKPFCNEDEIKESIKNAPRGSALNAASVKEVCRELEDKWFFKMGIDISRPSLEDVSNKEIADFKVFADKECVCRNNKNPDNCTNYTNCKEKNIIESVRDRKISCMNVEDPYENINKFNAENGTNLEILKNPTICKQCTGTCSNNVNKSNSLNNIHSVRSKYYANCTDINTREEICKNSYNPFDNPHYDNYYKHIEKLEKKYKSTGKSDKACGFWNGRVRDEIWEGSRCIRTNISTKNSCKGENNEWSDAINKCVVLGKSEYFCRKETNHEWWHGRCFWRVGNENKSSEESCRGPAGGYWRNNKWINGKCYSVKESHMTSGIGQMRNAYNLKPNKYKNCQDKKNKEDDCKKNLNIYTEQNYKSCKEKKDTEDYCKSIKSVYTGDYYNSCKDLNDMEIQCRAENNLWESRLPEGPIPRRNFKQFKNCQEKKDTENKCKLEGWDNCQNMIDNLGTKCKKFVETNEGCQDNSSKETDCITGLVGRGYCLCADFVDDSKTRKVKKITCEKSSINCNDICKDLYIKKRGGSLIHNKNLVNNITQNITANENQSLERISRIRYPRGAKIKVKTNNIGEFIYLKVVESGQGYKENDILKIYLHEFNDFMLDRSDLEFEIKQEDINEPPAVTRRRSQTLIRTIGDPRGGSLKIPNNLINRIINPIKGRPNTTTQIPVRTRVKNLKFGVNGEWIQDPDLGSSFETDPKTGDKRIVMDTQLRPPHFVDYDQERKTAKLTIKTDNVGSISSVIIDDPGKGFKPKDILNIDSWTLREFFKWTVPQAGDVLKIKLKKSDIKNNGGLKKKSLFNRLIKNFKYKPNYNSVFRGNLFLHPTSIQNRYLPKSSGAKFNIKTSNEWGWDGNRCVSSLKKTKDSCSLIHYKWHTDPYGRGYCVLDGKDYNSCNKHGGEGKVNYIDVDKSYRGEQYIPGEKIVIPKNNIPGAKKNLIFTINTDNIEPWYDQRCSMKKDYCNLWIPSGQGKTCTCKYNRIVNVNKNKNKFGTTCIRECKKPPEHTFKRGPVYTGVYWDTKEKKTTPGCIGWTETKSCGNYTPDNEIKKGKGCTSTINKDQIGFCTCLSSSSGIEKYYCPTENKTDFTCQKICEKEGHEDITELPYNIFRNNYEVIIHIKKEFVSNDEDNLNKIIKLKFPKTKIKKIQITNKSSTHQQELGNPIHNIISVTALNSGSAIFKKELSGDGSGDGETIDNIDKGIDEIEFYHKHDRKKNLIKNNKYSWGKISDIKIILSNITDEKSKKISYYLIN
jgi:hypothetical protein